MAHVNLQSSEDVVPARDPAQAVDFVGADPDGLVFHRVIADFMIQGGDPLGTGTGGPGYKFADEPFEGDYERGAVAMANAGPNTNGSQFFICVADLSGRLPKNYTIFGQVVERQNVISLIGTVQLDADDKPVKPVKLNRVVIERVSAEPEKK